MMTTSDREAVSIPRLKALAERHAEAYRQAKPFPHIAIDDFVDSEVLLSAARAFPTNGELQMYRYDNPLERKLAFDQVARLPRPLADVLHAMNSPAILKFMEWLTGIDKLIPDPYYRGGGIHQVPPGGKLDIHIDFNVNDRLGLHRRINAILYLNQDWKPEYGGELELWRGHQENGRHVLDECIDRVLPVFNRLVVFNTSSFSYHGQPDPLRCPADRSRNSLATYYYTAPTLEELSKPHSTVFVKRPGDPDDPELDALRERRSRERLSSNVKLEY